MFSRDYIIDNAEVFVERRIAGVYFLINRHREIIYIGSTEHLLGRLKMHRANPKMSFDRWYYIPFENLDFMRYEEQEYIKMFCPRFNKKDNPVYENEEYQEFVYGSKKYKTPLSKDQVVEVIEEIKNHDKNGNDE